MTYEKIVEKVKKALAKVDASAVKGHLAVQVDVYGEGEGAFYIEVKDGKVDVQPYEYFDHDLRIRCTGEEIIAIAEGKKKILDEVAAENIEALRNVSRLGDFDLVFVGRSVKNKAAKKTKVSVPAKGKKETPAKAVKKETAAKVVKAVKKETGKEATAKAVKKEASAKAVKKETAAKGAKATKKENHAKTAKK